MKHTECKDCKLREGDCGHHFKMNGKTNYDIPRLASCDRYGNCEFFIYGYDTMDDKKALELLKSMHRRDFICSECQKDDDECKSTCEYGKALDCAIKALENSSWIPVKTRELSAEEVKEVNEKYDVDLDGDEAWCICSPLPADAQEVLITTKYGDVVLTEFCVDVDGCWFDGYEDRGDVLAWMPLPKPYTKEDADT